MSDKEEITDRMKKARREAEKLPAEKKKELVEMFIGINRNVDIERGLDILFSELTEDQDQEPGLIFIGRIEAAIRELKEG